MRRSNSLSVKNLVVFGALMCLSGLVLASPASAIDSEERCLAGKLRAAGTYSRCLAREWAEVVASGESPDFSDCERTVGYLWSRIESRGGGRCPNDQGFILDVAGLVETQIADLAAQLDASTEPDFRCEIRKLNIVGFYQNCRLKALGTAIRRGRAPALTRCDRLFTRSFQGIDGTAGSDCPGGAGVLADIQAAIDLGTQEIAQQLDGTGP